jgi:tRNA-Thr(GGU) m(6)t(6)A37 methyltransferase TsaA
MEVQPIGMIHSPVTELTEEQWGDVISEIHLDERYAPGLQGIDSWSHIMVVYYMHQAPFDLDKDLIRRPRSRQDMPEIGVFANRSPNRPNGIGITTAEVIKVEANVLTVRRLDAIDGTPVLDIKPYAPVYDSVYEPLIPVWFIRLMQGYY